MLRRKPSKAIACKTNLAWYRLRNGNLSQPGSYLDWFLNAVGSVLRNNILDLYPNPASSTVTRQLRAQEDIITSVTIYNAPGERQSMPASHRDNFVTLDTGDLKSGVYIASVSTQNKIVTARFAVMRRRIN